MLQKYHDMGSDKNHLGMGMHFQEWTWLSFMQCVRTTKSFHSSRAQRYYLIDFMILDLAKDTSGTSVYDNLLNWEEGTKYCRT